MTDGKGHKLHPSPVFSEGRYERGVFIDLIVELNVAAEVPVEADISTRMRVHCFCRRRLGRERECLGPLLRR